MANSEIEQLRAQVANARKNAGGKAVRLRRDQGIRVAGSDQDPRRAAGVERSYNARQLKTYLGQLKGFNARSTQFVKGSQGAPIPKALASQLMAAQRSFNRARDRQSASVTSRKLPGHALTLGEEYSMINRGRGFDDAGPMSRANFRVEDTVSASAARKLQRTLERRSTPSSRRDELRRSRNVLAHKASYVGDAGALSEKIASLSDDQVMAAWSSPNFMDALNFATDSDQYSGWVDEDPTEFVEGRVNNAWGYLHAIEQGF